MASFGLYHAVLGAGAMLTKPAPSLCNQEVAGSIPAAGLLREA